MCVVWMSSFQSLQSGSVERVLVALDMNWIVWSHKSSYSQMWRHTAGFTLWHHLLAPRLLSCLQQSLFAVCLNISVPIRAEVVHFSVYEEKYALCVISGICAGRLHEDMIASGYEIPHSNVSVWTSADSSGSILWGRAQTWGFYISCALLSESPSSVVGFLKRSI